MRMRDRRVASWASTTCATFVRSIRRSPTLCVGCSRSMWARRGPTQGGGFSLPESPQSVWAFTIKGTAFLYHQVRCMVAVLFLVGEGKEDERIISDLLDLERSRGVRITRWRGEAQLLYDITYDIAYDSRLPYVQDV